MYVLFPNYVLDTTGSVRFLIVFILHPLLVVWPVRVISMRITFVVNNHIVDVHLQCP